MVGATLIVAPVPASVPPHDPVYHLTDAPVPRLPPDTVRFVLPPAHMAGVAAVAVVGATEAVLTVTVTCAQAVIVVHGDPSSNLT